MIAHWFYQLYNIRETTKLWLQYFNWFFLMYKH